MAKRILKQKALSLRKKGMSYSEIRNLIDVSKSTLSLWLRDLPLNKKRISELRDNNPKRIENYRNTMARKREEKISEVYILASNEIGKITERDLFIGGIFLYMGEGSKTTRGTTALTNTNPHILRLFVKWLHLHHVKEEKIKVQLHLYSNMNIEKQINFWSKSLSLPKNQFRKPYIKKNTTNGISYMGQFGQGTCTVLYEDVNLYHKTLMYLKFIQSL